MAITFPASPSDGDVFTNATTGVKYIYNATDGVWKTHVWPTNTDYLQLSGGTLTGDLSLGTNDLAAQDITTTGAVSVGTGLTVGNGLTVSDGNVVMADGHGIDFSATGDGNNVMDNELFDDYEEGIWQPKFFNDQNGAITVNTGSRAAKYVKIGRTVYITCYIQCNSKGTNTGNVTVDNLPYSTDTNGQLHGALVVSFFAGLNTNNSTLYATAQPNSRHILIRKVNSTADSQVSTLTATQINNGFDLIVGGSYITAI